MNLPSLDSLLCFEAAARLLSFREAAQVVCLTPAAVSQRIKQLEDQLGQTLFHRTSRSVQLTEAGLALVPAARAAIAAAEACTRAVQRGAGPPPQELTVGTSFEIGLAWVTPAVVELCRQMPQLVVHLFFGSAPDSLARVRSREIDACVTSYSPLDPVFDGLHLGAEQYSLCAAPSLLRRTPLERVEDAAQHTILDLRADLPMLRHFSAAPIRFGSSRYLGSIGAMRIMALAGIGVAPLPLYTVDVDLSLGRLVSVLPELTPAPASLRLVFLADDTRKSAFQEIARVLQAQPLTSA